MPNSRSWPKKAKRETKQKKNKKLYTKKKSSSFGLIKKSLNLKFSLLKKENLLTIKRRPSSIKYCVISLLPNLPRGDGEDFHEGGTLELLLCLYHHLEETCSQIPLNAQMLLASLTEGATKPEHARRPAKLGEGIYTEEELMTFVFTKSTSLQSGLFTEEALPRL